MGVDYVVRGFDMEVQPLVTHSAATLMGVDYVVRGFDMEVQPLVTHNAA